MIKVTGFTIDNFKSLKQFDLNLSKFSCLIGLNSAGKSTILQAIDFISQQMHGDISGWLKDRKWEARELNSKLFNRKLIRIEVRYYHNEKFYRWGFGFNTLLQKCTYEF
ncbi:MAG: AAA family ATPase, partial [Campylobacterales bacterium]|nr:AAA family ATPase [Campylobacterales bacterium]